MEIKVVEQEKYFHPKLKEVLAGAMVRHQNHVYIKLHKGKIGEGLYLQWPNDYSILLNPRYGSIRAVNAEVKVTILAQAHDMEVYEIKHKADAYPYLRQE